MSSWRVVSALALVALTPSAASAYVPERTPHRDAEASARRMIARPAARGTTVGVIVTRGGRTIVSMNGRRAMTPASLMKIPTTTAAMVRFGPDHRFVTRAMADRRRGVARALYLVGGGDPTFSTEAYRKKRYEPKNDDLIKRPAFQTRSPTVEQLAARIRDAGVTAVAGDVIADESLFDTKRTQEGWLPSYLTNDPDVSYLSALGVNEGRTGPEREQLLPSPALSAGRALRRALSARGVSVSGSVRIGRAPDDAVEIARVASPPLSEIVDFINRYSVNYPSELLLKSMGARFGGAGTTAAGVRMVLDTLAELKVPLDGFRMTDGSGLSVLDRMAPVTLAAILDRILSGRGEGWDALRSSIPIAGGPGTLLNRMKDPPTGGNLRGKTGQIRRVRAMAGWTIASDGVPLVYVAIFNDASSPFALTGPLDSFGRGLTRFPRS